MIEVARIDDQTAVDASDARGRHLLGKLCEVALVGVGSP
jgi:hypothetical protein